MRAMSLEDTFGGKAWPENCENIKVPDMGSVQFSFAFPFRSQGGEGAIIESRTGYPRGCGRAFIW